MIVVVSRRAVGRGRPRVKEGGSCRDRWDSTVAIGWYTIVGTGEGPERDRRETGDRTIRPDKAMCGLCPEDRRGRACAGKGERLGPIKPQSAEQAGSLPGNSDV